MALGKSLESLIPTDLSSFDPGDIPKDVIEEKFDPTSKTDTSRPAELRIPLSKIQPNEHQPRVNFKEGPMADLVESIRVHGVIQPVVVSPLDPKDFSKGYNLVAGERRWRASKHLKLKTIPAIVRTPNEQQKLELALVENVQREDLGPLETATAYLKLHQQFNLSYEEVGQKVGKAMTTVFNAVRLLSIPAKAKEALYSKKITEGHAKAIAALNNFPSAQEALLDHILDDGWTVRKSEHYAMLTKQKAKLKDSAKTEDVFEFRNQATKSIHNYLKTDVRLVPRAKGGRIVIDYKDDKHLDKIAKLLQK